MENLPEWQSHKIVKGDKIIADEPGLIMHTWSLDCGMSVEVSPSLEKRVPDGVDPVGGYYVLYKGGFESWSTAEAFEDGYTRL